jgi:hypothetical protein
MFLHTEYFNEGGSVLFPSGRKKMEIREGRNPGSNSLPGQWIHPWITRKKDTPVNQRWKKLQFPNGL